MDGGHSITTAIQAAAGGLSNTTPSLNSNATSIYYAGLCVSIPSQLTSEVDLSVLPDTSAQLGNRAKSAALLRYAGAHTLRTHGHHATAINPLGLLQ